MATAAWTSSFMAKVNDQVTKAMVDVQADFDHAQASSAPKKFEDILGASDDDYWWRLYINPMDWNEAQAGGKDPRMLYDKDNVERTTDDGRPKAKGFRKPMVTAYDRFLKKGELSDRLTSNTTTPLTHNEYISELFQTAKAKGQAKEVEARFRMVDAISFTAPEQIDESLFSATSENFVISDDNSDDEAREIDMHLTLVADGRNAKKRGREDAYCVWDPKKSMSAIQTGETLYHGIDQVFVNFNRDMKKAALRSEQLRAIARAIRNLHIMHTFTDACGRTNIFLLLPMMLLHYGFGLPLGGEHGGQVDREALMMMFNGGYTLDQITRFLWVTQDFGLENRRAGKATCIGPASSSSSSSK